VHLHHIVLSLLSAFPADAGRTVPPPVPAGAALESLPTAHAQLPPRPKPASHDWMLSVEGATRVPVDMGVQATLESPYLVRVSASYGWVPAMYSSLFTGIASSASNDATVSAVLNHTRLQGRTFRTAIGVRPFAKAGLHLDVGYARVSLDGDLDLATSGVPALEALGGAYQAHTTVDAWLVEIGSQVEAWGVVFGFAFGLMGTFAAQTSINAVNGAPASPALGEAARQTESALKSYGFVPTLTLRLGFDMLSMRRWMPSPG
jgi:hypothetical protein